METASLPNNPALDLADAESRCDTNQLLTSFGAIVGSVAMAGQNIFTEMHFHGWLVFAITMTSLGGWLVFGMGALRNRRLGQTPEGKAFFEIVRSDELYGAHRSQALAVGFAAMLGVQVILLVLWAMFSQTGFGLLTISVAASSTIAAGVAGSVIRYQILTNR